MQKKLAIYFLIFASLICGCASNPSVEDLSSEQRSQYSRIAILDSPPAASFETVGVVKGISCHRNAYQKNGVTSDEAIYGIKLEAAKLKADAVINMVCQEKKEADWGNNCWQSYVCVGDAIKYK